MKARHALARGVVVLALLVGVDAVSFARQTPTELLPDLQVGELYGFRIEQLSGGQLLLRFGTIGFNLGAGPLEARGRRFAADGGAMMVTQRIYNSAGGHRERMTSGVMIYDTGDNHDHWHFRNFISVVMYKRGFPDGSVRGLRKLGFCLIDVARHPSPPPGSPSTRSYPVGSCGNASSTSVRTGLTVGWGDDYPPHYAHQWVDLTAMKSGTFRICAMIDPLDDFVELREKNNERWTDVRISVSARTVTVLDTGIGNCGRRVP